MEINVRRVFFNPLKHKHFISILICAFFGFSILNALDQRFEFESNTEYLPVNEGNEYMVWSTIALFFLALVPFTAGLWVNRWGTQRALNKAWKFEDTDYEFEDQFDEEE